MGCMLVTQFGTAELTMEFNPVNGQGIHLVYSGRGSE